nr:hypothetical protein asmbl_11 [uncultured bacterium]
MPHQAWMQADVDGRSLMGRVTSSFGHGDDSDRIGVASDPDPRATVSAAVAEAAASVSGVVTAAVGTAEAAGTAVSEVASVAAEAATVVTEVINAAVTTAEAANSAVGDVANAAVETAAAAGVAARNVANVAVNVAASVVKPATVADAAVSMAGVAATSAHVARAQAWQLLGTNQYGASQLQQIAGLVQRRLRVPTTNAAGQAGRDAARSERPDEQAS